MIERQPESLIDDKEEESRCGRCGGLLEPILDNVGFNEPGAEHYEVDGYKKCHCMKGEYDD